MLWHRIRIYRSLYFQSYSFDRLHYFAFFLDSRCVFALGSSTDWFRPKVLGGVTIQPLAVEVFSRIFTLTRRVTSIAAVNLLR